MVKFFTIGLTLILFSCGGNKEESNPFGVKILNSKPAYTTADKISFAIENSQGKKIDSAVYFLDTQRLGNNTGEAFELSLEKQKMGLRKIHAQIFTGKKEYTVAADVLHLAATAPKLYTYKIINEYPHDMDAYTQGLEFVGDTLYESTGQYGKSSLRKTDYKTGKVLQQINLDRTYFGEGITVLNSKIYQLTWREKVGFIYQLDNLEKTGSFVYSKSPEGWGLCNDGKRIYKSDGTEKIWTLNSENLTEESYIEIYTNTSRIESVNELEWVDGKIFANIYQRNAIAIINPDNGAVEGVIDVSDLQNKVSQHQFLDVLNGIAYKGEPNRLFVTGKNWDKLFEIEYFEKQ